MREGWKVKTLGEVCQFIDYRGKTPKKTSDGLRLITAKNIKMGFLQKEPLEYVNPAIYDAWMTRGIPQYGDVLFTTEAPLANVAQLNTNEKVVFAQRIIILQPLIQNLDRTFLKYLLLWDEMQKAIRVKGTGMTVQGIKASLLKKIEIRFPPLPEQQRIVNILDKAMADIATVKANTEKNLQNARDLFESYLQFVFTQCNKKWDKKMLSEICLIRPPKTEARGRVSSDAMVTFLPMEDLKVAQKYPKVIQTKKMSDVIGNYTYFAEGDVLLAKITPCFENGKLGIAKGLTNGIGFGSSEFIVIRPSTIIDKNWLYYFLSRESFRKTGEQHMGGAVGHKRISKQYVETVKIPVPQISEQQQIVSILDILSIETQHLTTLYQRKLTALEELKKSLLHQAFNGDL